MSKYEKRMFICFILWCSSLIIQILSTSYSLYIAEQPMLKVFSVSYIVMVVTTALFLLSLFLCTSSNKSEVESENDE